MLINKFECKPVCAGNNIKKVGHLDVNDKGESVVIFSDTKDTDKIIQSYADQCKIENIIARYASGDLGALVGSRGEGNYLDKETCEALQRGADENEKILEKSYSEAYESFLEILSLPTNDS